STSSSDASSSSSSDSDSDEDDELEKTKILKRKTKPSPSPDSSSSLDSDSDSDKGSKPPTAANKPKRKAVSSSIPRKPNVPFQRVKADTAKNHDERLRDNAFESRVCPASCGARPDDYGARAHQDLIVTRGDGFRKEKNKKKRGSYRGGNITLESHSFKFKFED
ncbi:SRP40, C-terminal domain-containing protein, partial [Lactifluus subvellereus]